MAHNSNLPCDGDGICMSCKKKPSQENETLTCKTCVTPWHVDCLNPKPQTLTETIQWECPDCSLAPSENDIVSVNSGNGIVSAIRAIESDKSLNEAEKAKRRQEIVSGKVGSGNDDVAGKSGDVLGLLAGSLNCSFCMQLPDRPVTTPCGHNFCLKCFQKWVGQGKRTCAICRSDIPAKMSSQPRINSVLVMAIRMAKMSRSNVSGGAAKVYHFVHNQNRPDKAYTTDRAKKAGKANACSGKIFVTVPPDHFGPITAEYDPDRNMGVMVGESWEDRMECRQWGAHLPHVAGIAGQSEYGAQSVALSGGYLDDEDHGEWFLYTGSGGRDLSGNKRTNKEQSFDQKFEKMNEALRVSCLKGYPVRVVRSHKEKRSSYAPEIGVRYDGVYRIEKCWRKQGIQGFKVCRYLFMRCDNDPAPWTSDEHGDRPRPLPNIKELKGATDVTERKASPSWDYDEEKGWMWKKPPPNSRKRVDHGISEDGKRERTVRRQAHTMSVKERLLKEFCCLICRKVMILPLTTPCAHNFCKPCLEAAFAGQTLMRQRTCEGRRTLRAQKNIMKCPSCSKDISDYLQNPQVNRELMGVIDSLQQKTEDIEEQAEKPSEETGSIDEKCDDVVEETYGKTDEVAEETDDKTNEVAEETDQKSDEVCEEKEVCIIASQSLEEVKKGIVKPSVETKTQGLDKQMEYDVDDPLPKPKAAIGNIKSSPIKPASDSDKLETAEVESKMKKVTKRKLSRNEEQQSQEANVGVRIRRQKTSELE